MTNFLFDGPDRARKTLVLTHGAGGGMRTPFMASVAREVAAAGIRVVRFEFDYMAQKKKRPDSTEVAMQKWRDVVEELGGGPKLFIGGKSFGGRMASMVADELSVRGLVCLGYPFHPPGQKDKLRTEHLKTMKTPTLIVQGTKDAFGNRGEVEKYKLSRSIEIAWVEGADHSFRNQDHVAQLIEAIVRFVTTA